ncbi:unnamed protein product [Rhizophagus irregularis]|nr:unnamed protein product [Rhizophagus irregularis]
MPCDYCLETIAIGHIIDFNCVNCAIFSACHGRHALAQPLYFKISIRPYVKATIRAPVGERPEGWQQAAMGDLSAFRCGGSGSRGAQPRSAATPAPQCRRRDPDLPVAERFRAAQGQRRILRPHSDAVGDRLRPAAGPGRADLEQLRRHAGHRPGHPGAQHLPLQDQRAALLAPAERPPVPALAAGCRDQVLPPGPARRCAHSGVDHHARWLHGPGADHRPVGRRVRPRLRFHPGPGGHQAEDGVPGETVGQAARHHRAVHDPLHQGQAVAANAVRDRVRRRGRRAHRAGAEILRLRAPGGTLGLAGAPATFTLLTHANPHHQRHSAGRDAARQYPRPCAICLAR